jgi:hypothetical protein
MRLTSYYSMVLYSQMKTPVYVDRIGRCQGCQGVIVAPDNDDPDMEMRHTCGQGNNYRNFGYVSRGSKKYKNYWFDASLHILTSRPESDFWIDGISVTVQDPHSVIPAEEPKPTESLLKRLFGLV